MNCKKIYFQHKEIETELKEDLRKLLIADSNFNNEIDIQKELDILLEWLRGTPKMTTIRVNTLLSTSDMIISHLRKTIESLPRISTYPGLPELIVVASQSQGDLESGRALNTSEHFQVIVDESCAAAVLRGSHIFAPGVMGLTSGANVGDDVEVYADILGQCRKGFAKKYEGSKVFIGIGSLQQNRNQIFADKSSGIAVLMTKTTSGLPQLSNESLPAGSGLLQNLPSIICSRILDPQPGETILDMCAAPGNKTTHLSSLMNNTGIIIAMDKVKSKISRLQSNCDNFGCKNVKIFCFDATKAAELEFLECKKEVADGPPFQKQSFDRILLDGPCSALGKRPQLSNKISLNELRSFVSLQRKIFTAAVELLRPGGLLVYSTCTTTIAENEGIVAWALRKYSCLQLKSAEEKTNSLGLFVTVGSGYIVKGLSYEQAECLLRFGPETDTVGFFIACFIKQGQGEG